MSSIGFLPFLMIYAYVVVPLAPIIYLFIKWRSLRDSQPQDSQLGIKVVLYYFKTIGYHLILVGLTMIGFLVFAPRAMSGMDASGVGFLVGGGIIYGLHYFLIKTKTNTRELPACARVYNAVNLIITGIIGTIFLVIFVNGLFVEIGNIAVLLGGTLVYCLAWGFQTYTYISTDYRQAE